MPKTLTHRTIRITRPVLKQLGACNTALHELERDGLLPATLHTDPDENIGLALKIVQRPRGRTNCLVWLRNHLFNSDIDRDMWQAERLPYLHQNDFAPHVEDYGEFDPTIAAQILAMAADALCVKRGR